MIRNKFLSIAYVALLTPALHVDAADSGADHGKCTHESLGKNRRIEELVMRLLTNQAEQVAVN